MPAHVVQRGNNRTPCFFQDEDYRFFKTCLEDACRRYRVRVHAYVLMTNHVHLLMTPEDVSGISRVMQSVGRRYVQYVNRSNRRTGTLWEGRHKGSLIDADAYMIACARYIELNPVRAAMAQRPGDYPWSSFRHLAWGEPDTLVEPHPLYRSLGDNDGDRRQAYGSFFESELPRKTVDRAGPGETPRLRASREAAVEGGERWRMRIICHRPLLRTPFTRFYGPLLDPSYTPAGPLASDRSAP